MNPSEARVGLRVKVEAPRLSNHGRVARRGALGDLPSWVMVRLDADGEEWRYFVNELVLESEDSP